MTMGRRITMTLPFRLDFAPPATERYATWADARDAAKREGHGVFVTVDEPCSCCPAGFERHHRVYPSGRIIPLPY